MGIPQAGCMSPPRPATWRPEAFAGSMMVCCRAPLPMAKTMERFLKIIQRVMPIAICLTAPCWGQTELDHSRPVTETSPPIVEASASAAGSSVLTATTGSVEASASQTASVPVSSVPWGSSLVEYLKLLEDESAVPEQLERARREFDSRFSTQISTSR